MPHPSKGKENYAIDGSSDTRAVAAPEAQRFSKLGLHGRLEVDAFEDAILEVFIEDEQSRLLKPGPRCEQLCQDVRAGSILLEHLAETPDLPLYSGEAVEELLLVFCLHDSRLPSLDGAYPYGVYSQYPLDCRISLAQKHGSMRAMAEIREVTDTTFDSDVVKGDLPTLVDFWAPWCGPCRMVAPIVEELGDEYAGKVNFFKMNTDENPAVPTKFGIRSIPTLLVFKDGKLAGQIVGYRPKSDLKKRLDEVLN